MRRTRGLQELIEFVQALGALPAENTEYRSHPPEAVPFRTLDECTVCKAKVCHGWEDPVEFLKCERLEKYKVKTIRQDICDESRWSILSRMGIPGPPESYTGDELSMLATLQVIPDDSGRILIIKANTRTHISYTIEALEILLRDERAKERIRRKNQPSGETQPHTAGIISAAVILDPLMVKIAGDGSEGETTLWRRRKILGLSNIWLTLHIRTHGPFYKIPVKDISRVVGDKLKALQKEGVTNSYSFNPSKLRKYLDSLAAYRAGSAGRESSDIYKNVELLKDIIQDDPTVYHIKRYDKRKNRVICEEIKDYDAVREDIEIPVRCRECISKPCFDLEANQREDNSSNTEMPRLFFDGCPYVELLEKSMEQEIVSLSKMNLNRDDKHNKQFTKQDAGTEESKDTELEAAEPTDGPLISQYTKDSSRPWYAERSPVKLSTEEREERKPRRGKAPP